MIKYVTINQFLFDEVRCCFVCGAKTYLEFYVSNYLYRVCQKCIKKKSVKEFFKGKTY